MIADIDTTLLDRCARKDKKAQFELYKQCYSFLFGIGLRYKNNKEDADALVNLCFLKVLAHIDKYKREVNFKLWIRRIMINTVIDEFRREKLTKEKTDIVDFSDEVNKFDESVVNDFAKHADAEYLHQLIASLPPMSQKVFNLYAIDGYSHKEIGDMLTMSEGTSKWHLNFARTRLKELLEKAAKKEQKLAI